MVLYTDCLKNVLTKNNFNMVNYLYVLNNKNTTHIINDKPKIRIKR